MVRSSFPARPAVIAPTARRQHLPVATGIRVSRLFSAGVQAESPRADRFRLSHVRNFEPQGFTELEASQIN